MQQRCLRVTLEPGFKFLNFLPPEMAKKMPDGKSIAENKNPHNKDTQTGFSSVHQPGPRPQMALESHAANWEP